MTADVRALHVRRPRLTPESCISRITALQSSYLFVSSYHLSSSRSAVDQSLSTTNLSSTAEFLLLNHTLVTGCQDSLVHALYPYLMQVGLSASLPRKGPAVTQTPEQPAPAASSCSDATSSNATACIQVQQPLICICTPPFTLWPHQQCCS